MKCSTRSVRTRIAANILYGGESKFKISLFERKTLSTLQNSRENFTCNMLHASISYFLVALKKCKKISWKWVPCYHSEFSNLHRITISRKLYEKWGIENGNENQIQTFRAKREFYLFEKSYSCSFNCEWDMHLNIVSWPEQHIIVCWWYKIAHYYFCITSNY